MLYNINASIYHQSFVCIQLNSQRVLVEYRTLTSTTTPDQSGPGSNSKEEVFHIPQSFRIEALPSDGLMSYLEHSVVVVGGSYPSTEIQLAYSTAPTDLPSLHF